MHLINQFSSKFLLLYYNPPIDMISGFNTWNPEVKSPPTTRIQVPPAFAIKSISYMFHLKATPKAT
jgi:hypothetical protein